MPAAGAAGTQLYSSIVNPRKTYVCHHGVTTPLTGTVDGPAKLQQVEPCWSCSPAEGLEDAPCVSPVRLGGAAAPAFPPPPCQALLTQVYVHFLQF